MPLISEEVRLAYCLLADVVTGSVAKEVEIKVEEGVVTIRDIEGRLVTISDDGVVTIA